MNELANMLRSRADFRLRLLAGVSAAALTIYTIGSALADGEASRPTVWIELGAQLEQMKDEEQPFAPAFVANVPSDFVSPLVVQKPLEYSFGEEGSVSFQPAGSDLLLSASVRFGRSNGQRQKQQETANAHVPVHITTPLKFDSVKYPSSHIRFQESSSRQSESHIILDFQAGKDVGLGIFGRQTSSTFSAGVRYAQFSSKSTTRMDGEPDVHYPSQAITTFAALAAFHSAAFHFHDYAGTASAQKSFHGLGPSVSWKASTVVTKPSDRGEVAIDWGVNAAVLFGRQRAVGHHQSTIQSFYKKGFGLGKTAFRAAFQTVSSAVHSSAKDHDRARSVVVPNLGGFAGLSAQYSNAKVSIGYRADFFLGAMDGGIDTSVSKAHGFYGPFASISIGLGG